MEAKGELDASSSERIPALWTDYKDSIALYQANPTTENWRAMKRAYAMFKVAFVAEA